MLHSVAVLYHPRKPKAIVEAEWIGVALRALGVQVVLENAWESAAVKRAGCGRDLVVALGGDGTIMQVARLLAPCSVPVLGVNLGRVGFLAEMTPEALHEKVGELAAGKFWIERRSMLEVEWHAGESVERFISLNEVAVTRGTGPRAVHVRILLDDEEFMTYTADAVLVATATGSTAYSLAAGGPILYPEARDLMLTPVAPHLHIGRSIILPESMIVTLCLASDRPAIMSVDGYEERTLRPEHTVRVRQAELAALFARLGSCRYFYQAIAQRLR